MSLVPVVITMLATFTNLDASDLTKHSLLRGHQHFDFAFNLDRHHACSQSWENRHQQGTVRLNITAAGSATLALAFTESYSSGSHGQTANRNYEGREVLWKGKITTSDDSMSITMTERQRSSCRQAHAPCKLGKRASANTNLVLRCKASTAPIYAVKHSAEAPLKATPAPILRCVPDKLPSHRTGEDLGDLALDALSFGFGLSYELVEESLENTARLHRLEAAPRPTKPSP